MIFKALKCDQTRGPHDLVQLTSFDERQHGHRGDDSRRAAQKEARSLSSICAQGASTHSDDTRQSEEARRKILVSRPLNFKTSLIFKV